MKTRPFVVSRNDHIEREEFSRARSNKQKYIPDQMNDVSLHICGGRWEPYTDGLVLTQLTM